MQQMMRWGIRMYFMLAGSVWNWIDLAACILIFVALALRYVLLFLHGTSAPKLQAAVVGNYESPATAANCQQQC